MTVPRRGTRKSSEKKTSQWSILATAGRQIQSISVQPKAHKTVCVSVNIYMCISRVRYIKYFFKYISKVIYRVTVKIIREIQRYDQICHNNYTLFLSASEAVWRLLSFDLIDRNRPVVRFYVHFYNHHTV